MGIVWEAYHKRVPLVGVPEITLDLKVPSQIGDMLKIPRKVWRYTLPKKKTAGSPTAITTHEKGKEVMIFQTNLHDD